jgi:hypothetical protein
MVIKLWMNEAEAVDGGWRGALENGGDKAAEAAL